MRGTYDGHRLGLFVRVFLAESERLAARFARPGERVWQYMIADHVMPRHELVSARAKFSRMLSGKPGVEIRTEHVKVTIEVCRRLLHEQIGTRSPTSLGVVQQVEALACAKLGITGRRQVLPEDFLVEAVLDAAITPATFGLPDLIRGIVTDDFVTDLPRQRINSLSTLEAIAGRIGREQSTQRRLDLLYSAICAATIYEPGTDAHGHVLSLALSAAANARLDELADRPGVEASQQYLAAWIRTQIDWLYFIPTGNSIFNCLGHALHGTSIPSGAYERGLAHSAMAIEWSRIRYRISEGDPLASHKLASALSTLARFHLAGGAASDEQQGDRLYSEATKYFSRAADPFGLVYPVLKRLFRGQLSEAQTECSHAIEAADQIDNPALGDAFSAMLFQLTALRDGRPTGDQELRRRVRRIAKKPAAGYLYSHIYSARDVMALLAGRAIERPRRRWT